MDYYLNPHLHIFTRFQFKIKHSKYGYVNCAKSDRADNLCFFFTFEL